jgi:hypothetical protein
MIKNYYSTLFIFVAIYGLISSLGITSLVTAGNWTALSNWQYYNDFHGSLHGAPTPQGYQGNLQEQER